MAVLLFYQAALVLVSSGIVYQDLRDRMISLWLILSFGFLNIAYYVTRHSSDQLLENTVFCLSYFLFCYLVLVLFYFVKTKHFQKLTDRLIGWGDIWLLLLTGCCIGPEEMIFFFTLTFVTAILFQLCFFRKQQSIPLAGILMVCYAVYFFYANYFLF